MSALQIRRIYNNKIQQQYFDGFFAKSLAGWAIGFICAAVGLLQYYLTKETKLVTEFLTVTPTVLGFSFGLFGLCMCFFIRLSFVQTYLKAISRECFFWGWASSTLIIGFLFFILLYEKDIYLLIFILPIVTLLSMGNYIGYRTCAMKKPQAPYKRADKFAASLLLAYSIAFFIYVLYLK